MTDSSILYAEGKLKQREPIEQARVCFAVLVTNPFSPKRAAAQSKPKKAGLLHPMHLSANKIEQAFEYMTRKCFGDLIALKLWF